MNSPPLHLIILTFVRWGPAVCHALLCLFETLGCQASQAYPSLRFPDESGRFHTVTGTTMTSMECDIGPFSNMEHTIIPAHFISH
jgi:hypothetical protein